MKILVAFSLALPFREKKVFILLSENILNSTVFTTQKIIFFSKSQPGVFILFFQLTLHTTLTGNYYTNNNTI